MSSFRNTVIAFLAFASVSMAGSFGFGTNRNIAAMSYKITNVNYYASAIYCGTNLVWSSYVPWPNLISRWALDGDAVDSASGYNGTWNGTEAYTNGYRGQAALFSGGSYIDIGTVAELNAAVSGSFTISFWAFIKGGGCYIFGKGSELDSRLVAFGVWTPAAIGVADEGRYVIAEAAASTDMWQHWAWTFDPSATPSHNLYRNGSSVASSTVGFSAPYSGPLQISSGASGKGVDGAIDDMMVFDSALTSNNVIRVMNGLPPN